MSKNKKQELIDARMKATKAKLAGPKPDYSINKGVRDYDTIFFHAAMAADVKKMKAALKKGANINWQNPSNLNSPAHVAAWMGKSNAKVLKWLKKKGADMTLKDTKGRTPADIWAMTKDQKDMTKGLIRYRAQMEVKRKKLEQKKLLEEKKKALLSGDLNAIRELEQKEAEAKK
jgi:ankyrin repeat protein